MSTKENVDAYSTLETADDGLVLFVNSWEDPHKKIPMNHYRYSENGKNLNLSFCRLYRFVYLKDNLVEYSLLNWEEVKVKPHCQAALKQQIDSMLCVDEFLE